MGGAKWYNKLPGHTDNQYRREENSRITINGVTAEVLIKNSDASNGNHSNNPSYSNTSDMYFHYGKNGKEVVQGSLYIGRKKICDFDWSHEHINKGDGRHFPPGVVHVQFYTDSGDGSGNRVRKNNGEARYMNNAECIKYGPIIRHFNSKVKLKP